jgi:hypothetical protein
MWSPNSREQVIGILQYGGTLPATRCRCKKVLDIVVIDVVLCLG